MAQHPKSWDYYYKKIHDIERHVKVLKGTYERDPYIHQDLIDYWEEKIDQFKHKIETLKKKTN